MWLFFPSLQNATAFFTEETGSHGDKNRKKGNKLPARSGTRPGDIPDQLRAPRRQANLRGESVRKDERRAKLHSCRRSRLSRVTGEKSPSQNTREGHFATPVCRDGERGKVALPGTRKDSAPDPAEALTRLAPGCCHPRLRDSGAERLRGLDPEEN